MDKDLKSMSIDELKEFAERNNITIHHAVKKPEKMIEIIESELTSRESEVNKEVIEEIESETKTIESKPENEVVEDIKPETEITENKIETIHELVGNKKELTIDEKILAKEKEIASAKDLVAKIRAELSELIEEKGKTKKKLSIAEINQLSRGRRMSAEYIQVEKEKQQLIELQRKYGA